jgi:hypothetical protein
MVAAQRRLRSEIDSFFTNSIMPDRHSMVKVATTPEE